MLAKVMLSNSFSGLNPADFPSLEPDFYPTYKPDAIDGPYSSAIDRSVPDATSYRSVVDSSIMSPQPVPGDFLTTFVNIDSELRQNVPSHNWAVTPGMSTYRPTPKASPSNFGGWGPALQSIKAPQMLRSTPHNHQSNVSQPKPLNPLRQPYGPPTSNEKGFDFSLRPLPDTRFRSHRAAPSSSSLASLSYTNSSTPSILNSPLGSTEWHKSGNNQFSIRASLHPSQRQEKKVFVPSHMRLEKNGLAAPRHIEIECCRYKGDKSSTAFLTAVPHLENEFNCSLFITNIPVGTSGSDMFDRIRTGAVDALHFNPADKKHSTIAAKLVFTNPEGAARLYSHAQWPGVRIGDRRLYVMYNRDGVLSRDGVQSRILLIEGPEDMMTYEHWKAYFDEACVYQLDRWLYQFCSGLGRKRMEFRFYRVDGQAVTCYQKIRWDEELQGVVQVRYGRDVCANSASGAWNEYPK